MFCLSLVLQFFIMIVLLTLVVACRGLCINFKPEKRNYREKLYESDRKRCSVCEVYVNWRGTRCPCCSAILRSKPRGSKIRKKMLQTASFY